MKHLSYLVMEKVEGGDLYGHIVRNGVLGQPETVRMFRQIISAVTYCHQFSICHRDLKPENILLDRDLNVKIADFGMAALQPSGSWLRTACGSPHYCAPEIVSGSRYDGEEVDVWSCGVILYVMLTGRLPFCGEDLDETFDLVRHGVFRMPEDLSIEAKSLIRRMLEVDPRYRASLVSIWEHPLLSMDRTDGPFPGPLPEENRAVVPKHLTEIDEGVLSNLQTLLHWTSRAGLIEALLADE